jgi:hypothetical protein
VLTALYLFALNRSPVQVGVFWLDEVVRMEPDASIFEDRQAAGSTTTIHGQQKIWKWILDDTDEKRGLHNTAHINMCS